MRFHVFYDYCEYGRATGGPPLFPWILKVSRVPELSSLWELPSGLFWLLGNRGNCSANAIVRDAGSRCFHSGLASSRGELGCCTVTLPRSQTPPPVHTVSRAHGSSRVRYNNVTRTMDWLPVPPSTGTDSEPHSESSFLYRNVGLSDVYTDGTVLLWMSCNQRFMTRGLFWISWSLLVFGK